MGYPLFREVVNFAPGDWISTSLIVALIIADDANDETRRSWIALPELCRRARLKPAGVRRALSNIGKSGYEFRVSHGVGSDGRPVYAVKGHSVDYLVPDFTKGVLPVAPYEAIAATPVAANGHGPIFPGIAKALRDSPKALRDGLKGATAVAPLSSVSSDLLNYSPPVVPPSVEGSPNGHGGAPRQPIELEAWLASLEARRLGRQR